MLLTLLVEDDSSTWTTQSFVGGGSNYICIVKGRRNLLGCHEARNVGHIGHQQSSCLIANLLEEESSFMRSVFALKVKKMERANR